MLRFEQSTKLAPRKLLNPWCKITSKHDDLSNKGFHS